MYGRRTTFTLVALALALAIANPLAPSTLSSQTSRSGGEFFCNMQPTPEEAAAYLESLKNQGPQRAPGSVAQPYCVPIMAHIVRRTNGTGGITLAQYDQAIDDTNLLYAGTGIVFYTLGVDYIDDDNFYFNISSQADIDALRSTNVVAAAINVYFTPNLPGLCGISSFTFSAVQGIVMANGCTGTPSYPSVLAHEIGHYFNLFHTHETAFGIEFVDGTNCVSAGDQLCDTPADPLLGTFNVSTSTCTYFGTETDPHGDPYTPDPTQIMSYSPSTCALVFSPMSENKAVTTLLNQRPELLSRGCGAVTPPTLTEVTPGTGFVDQTKDVVLVGTNFGIFTTVDFGPDITVNSRDTLSTNDSLQCNITIAASATPGLRDVSADNANSPVVLVDAFEVLDTPVHYVIPGGGNVYPYGSPAEAATTLANAIGAASAGDTVKVDTTTINNVSSFVDKAIVLSGGWTDGYTARDLATKKTRLNLSGNLLVNAPSGTVTIDGFEMAGGTGAFDIAPVSGYYGGAMRVFSTAAVISSCDFHNNNAKSGSNFGGGGAIYAYSATVTIDNCSFDSNIATRGGAIFMYQAGGTISNSTVSNNTVSIGGVTNPDGGGIALQGCTGVSVTNVDISANPGAQNGGGIWASASTGVVVTGGSITGHSVAFSGGGIHAGAGSGITIVGSTISGNTSSIFGGAIAGDLSATTVEECLISGNTGVLGAGVYVSQAAANIRHNTIDGNSGAALYLSNASSGEVKGNTVNNNSAGFSLVSSPINVFNNIVASSTGIGIQCSGTAALLSYNDVWGSGGNDWDGCSAGTGSFSMDPLFVNAGSGDFHLAVSSPCIDSGEPSSGNDDPDGSRGDMGRYGSHTFTMDQPVYVKNVSIAIEGGDHVITWDPNPEGDIDYYAIYCDSVPGFKPGPANFFTSSPDTIETLGVAADTTYYVVCAVDVDGYAGGYSVEEIGLPDTGSAVGDIAALETRLEQNVPNPFNPQTTIRFSLSEPAHVKLVIYDVAGRVVRTLVNDARTPNQYRVTWNGVSDAGQRVASGVYFYRLDAGAFHETRKMVLLK